MNRAIALIVKAALGARAAFLSIRGQSTPTPEAVIREWADTLIP